MQKRAQMDKINWKKLRQIEILMYRLSLLFETFDIKLRKYISFLDKKPWFCLLHVISSLHLYIDRVNNFYAFKYFEKNPF